MRAAMSWRAGCRRIRPAMRSWLRAVRAGAHACRRDDAAAAAILAVAEGRRRAIQVEAKPDFQYAIV